MYLFYWIPTKEHINGLKDRSFIPSKSFVRKNISDIDKNKRLELTLEINNNYDIDVHLLKYDGSSFEYKLKYIQSDINGFIVYEISDKQLKFDYDRTIFEIQVYHAFKDFFHIHEYHEDKTDALIKAYSSNIKNIYPYEYIRHYLELYSKKFESYRELILQYPPEKILDIFQKDRKYKYVILRLKHAYRFIFKAEGEMLYAKFLLSTLLHCNEQECKNLYKEYEIHLSVYEKDFSILFEKYTVTSQQVDMCYDLKINQYQIYLAIFAIILSIVIAIL